MAAVALPDVPFSEQAWSLETFAAAQESPISRRWAVVAAPVARWRVQLAWRGIRAEAMRTIHAWLDALGGPAGQVRIDAPQPQAGLWPEGIVRGCLNYSAPRGAGAVRLIFDLEAGVTPATAPTVRAGQFFALPEGNGRGRLFRLTEDARFDPVDQGLSHVTTHPVRVTPPIDDKGTSAGIPFGATGIFRLADNDQGRVTWSHGNQVGSVALDFIEDIGGEVFS